ncbi:MAG TPA: hypothetical protein VN441_13335 [Syntrophomonas sp.]|nr:hypothetical protein [Syntrophomonas sp.]
MQIAVQLYESLAFGKQLLVVDTESACIFHLYDDRGIAIYAPEEALLSHIGTEHDDVPEEC